MKKIIALLLVAVMCLSFVACGNKDNDINESTHHKENENEKSCIHDFDAATCTTPEICKKCGITQGTPSHDYIGIKCSICSEYLVEVLNLNTPYKAKNGLTVVLNSYTVTEESGYFSHSISYTIKNEVPDSKLMEGSFKLFFTDKTGEPQYGAFDYLFFGEEVNRTYEWKVLKNQQVSVLEYNANETDAGLDDPFFRNEPIADSLHWVAQ